MATGGEVIAFYAQTSHRGGCLIWEGQVGRDGYGRFWSEGKSTLAHRWAWRVAGHIPYGMWVLHDETCDKRCVNTSHLRIGTPSENAIAAWQAGKTNHPRLSRQDMDGLRYLVGAGVPVKIATKAYGVHRSYLADRKYKDANNARRIA